MALELIGNMTFERVVIPVVTTAAHDAQVVYASTRLELGQRGKQEATGEIAGRPEQQHSLDHALG